MADLFLDDGGCLFDILVGKDADFNFEVEFTAFFAEADAGFTIGNDVIAGIFDEVDEGGADDADFSFLVGGEADDFVSFTYFSPDEEDDE